MNTIVVYALTFFGLLILVVGLGVFITGMSQDTTMKFERLESTTQFIGQNETQAVAVFVYPYGGLVGVVANIYPLSIIVSYSNVNNGTLHIEDDFVNYGTYYNWTEARDYKDVTGTGTVVFDMIPLSYVGLHFLLMQPNYVPTTTPIEINAYAGYYGYTSHQDFIIAGFSLGLIGSLLASIGATQVISLRTSKSEKAESNQ